MYVEKIYAYPIKALGAVELSYAEATRDGLRFDRRFMLIQLLPDGNKNISIANFPQSILFFPSVRLNEATDVEELTVTHRPPGRPETTLTLPLTPVVTGLDLIDITMHKSPTSAYDMGPECNEWFSECYGFPVKLLYLGDNRRQVLFSDKSIAANARSWSALAASIFAGGKKDDITFADCAPYLVVSRTSLHDVSKRLTDDEEMDILKFRPNIIIEGAPEAWEEDYWSELAIGDVKFDLVHNCVRCKSINIDYATGKPGEGDSGSVLKKLQSDRRVDAGAKWSPVFGRYTFMSRESQEAVISVGDEVKVLKKNAQRTKFDWPGLS